VILSCNRNCTQGQRKWCARAPLLFLCLLLFLRSTAAHASDARAALQNAASLFEQGKLEEADQQARVALSDPQTRPVACSVLGSIRLQQKRLPESASLLKEAIRLEPHLLGAHLSLAQVYTLQGKPELALPLYRRVLTLDPSNLPARFALAQSETEKGNYQKSLELANPVLPALKQSADGLFLLVTDYLKTGDRTAAAALASDWQRLLDVPADWSMKFALQLGQAGVVPEAIDILQGVQQRGSSSYELPFNLAGLYILKKDFEHALDAYDQALTLKPDSLPALQQAAAIAEDRGELERSLSYWMRAKKIEPNNPEILFGFGRVCLKMDLLEDAEPALTQAVSLRPDNASYRYTLAATQVGKKQFEAAQSILDGLLKQKPSDPQLHYALGSVLYLQSHLDDAAVHLRESVRLQPEQLAPYYYLALVARDQGRDAEAIQGLETLLQRYPDHAPSCEALGSLLMSAHRYPEAEASLEKAVRLNPKSVKANYQLGLLLTRMGKKEEADKQLELAKALRKDDAENSRLQLRLTDPDQ
jgi:tetratricopeptide (TPR) repeat protein